MVKVKQAKTVMVDIDDSILLWNPEKYPHNSNDIIILEHDGRMHKFLPHFNNIEFIRKLKLQGYGIIYWSAAGNDWAEKIVDILELMDTADVILSKPEFAIDDLLDARKIIKQVIWLDPVDGSYKRNE